MSNSAKTILGMSANINDFKADPNTVLEQSRGEVVAVLQSNQPYFYAVPPEVFNAMMDAIEDRVLLAQAVARLNDGKEPAEVNLDDL